MSWWGREYGKRKGWGLYIGSFLGFWFKGLYCWWYISCYKSNQGYENIVGEKESEEVVKDKNYGTPYNLETPKNIQGYKYIKTESNVKLNGKVNSEKISLNSGPLPSQEKWFLFVCWFGSVFPSMSLT